MKNFIGILALSAFFFARGCVSQELDNYIFNSKMLYDSVFEEYVTFIDYTLGDCNDFLHRIENEFLAKTSLTPKLRQLRDETLQLLMEVQEADNAFRENPLQRLAVETLKKVFDFAFHYFKLKSRPTYELLKNNGLRLFIEGFYEHKSRVIISIRTDFDLYFEDMSVEQRLEEKELWHWYHNFRDSPHDGLLEILEYLTTFKPAKSILWNHRFKDQL